MLAIATCTSCRLLVLYTEARTCPPRATSMRLLALLLLVIVVGQRGGTMALPDGKKAAEYDALVKEAEERRARTADPYGDQNLKDAAKFLSTRIRDQVHGGDKTKFFEHLDGDGDKAINIDELSAVQGHINALKDKTPGGVWEMMHNLLETKSKKGGFHAELFDQLDADGDGTVSHEEFHNEL
jgi:hypothetical protein